MRQQMLSMLAKYAWSSHPIIPHPDPDPFFLSSSSSFKCLCCPVKLCHALFKNPSPWCPSFAALSFSLSTSSLILPGLITRRADLSPISSASISRIVRWLTLRYLGIATLNSTLRSPLPARRPPLRTFIPMPDSVTRSPVPEPVGTLTMTSPSSVGTLISPPRTAVVSGSVAVCRISLPLRLNFGSLATRIRTYRSPFCPRILPEDMACPVSGASPSPLTRRRMPSSTPPGMSMEMDLRCLTAPSPEQVLQLLPRGMAKPEPPQEPQVADMWKPPMLVTL
ncbi:hypothetical protein HBH70_078360 [Parastagonospora nodorum]|nr:hypothetical protein HBH53_051950 [Parastagonospora nodorum]KAH3995649.1 hypothetical protein HBI10_169490 [Parastagonospora nodorum]KAH4015820.1 hypothetical protein HBI13_159080 [Parastagonospora nodorum]KAH4139085.1 hypothetical protein HBH45_098550 [Parastagonospora nodorum]KAH4166498.1 hypothetical protein HBH44_059710 [Parastagonospora nodorum]